ncbi:TolB family protein [Actinoplanes sp. NPDC051494]|uniref:TolB family protein n=1 Tax=Actinoplanes sp. NPDC051494 TaxID=3363907 RepID=UPI0037A8DF1E
MTAGLREQLRREAGAAKTYDVYERSLATARRTRRRTAVSWAAVVAAFALAVPFLPHPSAQPVVPADGVTWSLPDRVGVPAFGSADATAKPFLGAASMLFTGGGMRFAGGLGDTDRYALVGSSSDEYRTLRADTTDGPALLSPDGTVVATSESLVDLRTGDSTPSPGTPIAWSPDGRKLLTAGDRLAIADLDHGISVGPGTSVDLGVPDRSISAAWSPDGRRLAFVRSGRVQVVDEAGTQLVSFTRPGTSALAGKGAWLPDGSAFATVPTDSTAWSLRWFDATTGQEVTGPVLPAVTGTVTGGGILGWRPNGTALVFVYGYPTYENPQASAPPRALLLAPGAPTASEAFEVPDEITGLDVADLAIASGITRDGSPPFPIGPRAWPWVLGGLLVAAVLGGLIWRFIDEIRAWQAASPWNRD